MRKHLLTIGALSVLLLAGLAPVALADHEHREGSDTEDHRDTRDGEREHRDAAREAMLEHFRGRHGPKSSFVLNLTGTGKDDNNTAYTVTLDTSGKDLGRYVNGSLVGIVGQGKLHVVVKAPNGTVVKERNLHVRLVVRDLAGNATWTLVSKERQWDWEPRLLLHGTAVPSASGIVLHGSGHAAFRASQVGPLRLSLSVSGTLLAPPAPKVTPAQTESSSESSSNGARLE